MPHTPSMIATIKKPVLTIQLLGFNSSAELLENIANLANLPQESVIIRYIDNASTDSSVAIVRHAIPSADIVLLPKNIGFGGGHNIGLSKCTTSLVLILNPDVALNWPGIREVMKAFDNPEVGAAQGKLLKYQKNSSVSRNIDSTGIKLTLALNGYERGANEVDYNQYHETEQVLATSGACSIYRMKALNAVAHSGNEYFDEDFYMYKEDVDLGWRLNNAGWKTIYVPVLAGTHDRSLKAESRLGWKITPAGIVRRLKDPRTRYSFRNWIWMIAKNSTFKQEIAHELFIDLRIVIFMLLGLLYPPFITVWVEIIRGLPNMWDKRTKIHTT
jgi:GT2 family glycosyltransferase